MWSTSATLLILLFLVTNRNLIQYGETTTPAATPPAAAPSTPTPATGTPAPATGSPAPAGTPATGGLAGSLYEATSSLTNILGEVIQRFLQFKKNFATSRLEVISSVLGNSTAQLSSLLGGQRPGTAAPAAAAPPAAATPAASPAPATT